MHFIRNLKHILVAFGIVFFTILGVVRFFGASFLLPVTHFFVYQEGDIWLDRLYTYSFPPSEDIAIITIDDRTLNTLQKKNQSTNENLKMLTITKDVYIDLIEQLESVGVKGIAFDIVFQNSDPEEARFAQIMQDYKNIVIATTVGEDYGYIESNRIDDTICKDCYSGIPNAIYKNVTWGHVNIESLHDRRLLSVDISRAPYASLKTENERVVDTLPLALYKVTGGDTTGLFPGTKNGQLVLQPFFGGDSRGNPPRPYKTYSLSEILSLPLLQKNLKGKYVFVGESGTLIHDSFTSPVTGRLMDGVESHAHFLDGLLQKRFLVNWSVDTPAFFVGLVIFLFLMTSLYLLLPKFVSIFTAIFATIWMVWLSRFLFAQYNIVVDIGLVLMAGSILSFPLTYIYRFFIVEKEKRMLASAFSHYVDGRVVEQIAQSGKPINLGGESRRLTILFSDIAGFTTLSERLPPEDLFYLMSSYLSSMTGVLTKNGGTLDKYIGDSVMGFYGAPLINDFHAIDACETALKMREALPAFNGELKDRGFDPIDFRIGVATGDVVVGNIGSHDRFNYTVLGDTVNLASRLEGASKEYATHIIVSESTYLDAKDAFHFRKLDMIAVKGKTEGVAIYELIAKKSNTDSDAIINLLPYRTYERGLERYMEGNYLEAGKIFESNAKIDPPSEILAHRCLDILNGKIHVEDGIYRMEHK